MAVRNRKRKCSNAASRLKRKSSPQAGGELSSFCQSKKDRKKAAKTRLKNKATKANGQLKKGYKYAKGGRIVKVKK